MSDARIAAAQARAEAARARLAHALSALKQRLLPATIARHVAHDLSEKGQNMARASADAVKARPAFAAGAAALVALFLARKPLARLASPYENPETPAVRKRSAARSASRKADT